MTTASSTSSQHSATGAAAVSAALGEDASYRTPRSVEDVTRVNVELIRQLDQAALDKDSTAGRIAGAIAGYCGRIEFVWLHVAWFGGWIIMNSVRGLPHFDPYP